MTKFKSSLITPALALLLSTSLNAEQFTVSNLSLKEAIEVISQKSNMPYMVDGKLLEGKKAPNIKNIEGVQNALNEILKGTNLKAIIEDGTILIKETSISSAKKSILSEVSVVSASGYEQNLVDAPASITVVTAKDLERKSYRDVTDALQDIPGVTVEGGAGGKVESTAIYIRGMSEKYTLFMVDGKPQGSSQAYYNGFGSANEIGWMPPLSSIEKIEVIKGPMSSLYGSDALGGVINIITKKVSDKWTGNLSLDTVIQENGESGNSKQYRYYLSGPLIQDVLGLSLYGSKYHRDEDNYISGFREKDKFDNTAKLNWKINDQNSLELIYGKAKQENLGTVEKTGATTMNNYRENYALTHELNWFENKTTTYYTREDVTIDNGNSDSEYIRDSFNTKTIIPILDIHILTTGLDYKLEETKHAANRFHGNTSTTDLERWQGAGFLEDEWFVTDNWSVTTGLRYDKNEHYGSEFIPRLYNVYRLSEEFTLKGGISKGYVAPELKQADPSIGEQSGGNGSSVDIGNFDLKPESSVNYELALLWNNDSGFDSGVTLYHTEFEDKISKNTTCTSSTNNDGLCIYNGKDWRNINEYTNVSSAELQGLEVSTGYRNEDIKINLNYTLSDSEQKSGSSVGEPLNNLPKHMVNLGLDYYINKDISSWMKIKYKGKTIDDTNERPDYTLVDTGINYKFTKYSSIYSGIYNIFDKEITTIDSGKTLDGRRYNVGMKFDF